jgi:hypothetical protein
MLQQEFEGIELYKHVLWLVIYLLSWSFDHDLLMMIIAAVYVGNIHICKCEMQQMLIVRTSLNRFAQSGTITNLFSRGIRRYSWIECWISWLLCLCRRLLEYFTAISSQSFPCAVHIIMILFHNTGTTSAFGKVLLVSSVFIIHANNVTREYVANVIPEFQDYCLLHCSAM